MLEQFAVVARDAGRDPAGIGIKGRLNIIGGDPETWIKTRDVWRDAGASHFAISLNQSGFTSLDQHVAMLKAFIEAVK